MNRQGACLHPFAKWRDRHHHFCELIAVTSRGVHSDANEHIACLNPFRNLNGHVWSILQHFYVDTSFDGEFVRLYMELNAAMFTDKCLCIGEILLIDFGLFCGGVMVRNVSTYYLYFGQVITTTCSLGLFGLCPVLRS